MHVLFIHQNFPAQFGHIARKLVSEHGWQCTCHAGYCPTHWQKSLLPARYADKLRVLFDGVDTDIWRRQTGLPREIGPHRVDANTRIVTYVACGLVAMRGFDIFMKLAKRIYQKMPNALFVVVGSDQRSA
jgi:glycosyltransferase involved in cell wall biosynthesis